MGLRDDLISHLPEDLIKSTTGKKGGKKPTGDRKTGKVYVKRTITRMGKTFTQGFWVSPENVQKGDVVVKGQNVLDEYNQKKANRENNLDTPDFSFTPSGGNIDDETKARVAELLEDFTKERLMSHAKSMKITWTENDDDGINWMRCSMAIQKHMRLNPTPANPMPAASKPATTPVQPQSQLTKADEPKATKSKLDHKKYKPIPDPIPGMSFTDQMYVEAGFDTSRDVGRDRNPYSRNMKCIPHVFKNYGYTGVAKLLECEYDFRWDKYYKPHYHTHDEAEKLYGNNMGVSYKSTVVAMGMWTRGRFSRSLSGHMGIRKAETEKLRPNDANSIKAHLFAKLLNNLEKEKGERIDQVMYRGFTSFREYMPNPQVGDSFDLGGISSFTTDKQWGNKFTGMSYECRPNGRPMLAILPSGLVHAYKINDSQCDYQSEHLVPKDTKLRIKDMYYDPNESYPYRGTRRKGITIITLELDN